MQRAQSLLSFSSYEDGGGFTKNNGLASFPTLLPWAPSRLPMAGLGLKPIPHRILIRSSSMRIHRLINAVLPILQVCNQANFLTLLLLIAKSSPPSRLICRGRQIRAQNGPLTAHSVSHYSRLCSFSFLWHGHHYLFDTQSVSFVLYKYDVRHSNTLVPIIF